MYKTNCNKKRAMMDIANLQWMAIILATSLVTTVTSLSVAYASGRLGWW